MLQMIPSTLKKSHLEAAIEKQRILRRLWELFKSKSPHFFLRMCGESKREEGIPRKRKGEEAKQNQTLLLQAEAVPHQSLHIFFGLGMTQHEIKELLFGNVRECECKDSTPKRKEEKMRTREFQQSAQITRQNCHQGKSSLLLFVYRLEKGLFKPRRDLEGKSLVHC